MIKLNLFLKLSWLISGNFDGKKINKTIFQQFLQLFGIFLSLLEVLIAFIVIFKPNLKHYLIVLHLTDSKISQRLFTICTGLVHLGFLINRFFFFKFNTKPKKLKFLNYLLFKNEKELEGRYKIDKEAAKKTLDMIRLKEFGVIWIMQNLLTYGYFIVIQCLIARCIYLAYMNTLAENGINLLEFFFISIPASLALDLTFTTESFCTVSLYLTFIANCKFITYRVEDLNRKFKNLIKLQLENRKQKNNRSIKIGIRKILIKMNSILRFHDSTQYLADRSIAEFYLCVLLIALFFPYLMLFDKNSLIYQVILIIIYFLTITCVSYTIVWANTLVYKSFEEYRNLKAVFLQYSESRDIKFKLLNSVEKPAELIHFNCIGFFKYTKVFLLDWILNSITMIFLLFNTKNVYKNI